MEAVTFHVMNDLQHKDDVVAMMRSLYEEDHAAHPPNYSLFPDTIEHLVSYPPAGQIIVFKLEEELVGYALLIPYWSNEFGGVVLFVDELFVSAKYRNRGIAHSFFRYLAQEPPFGAVEFALEVSPSNLNAKRLYESLGFALRPNAILSRSSSFDSKPA